MGWRDDIDNVGGEKGYVGVFIYFLCISDPHTEIARVSVEYSNTTLLN